MTNNIYLRLARNTDLQRITEILQQANRTLWSYETDEAEVLEYYRRDDVSCYVLDFNGVVVAVSFIQYETNRRLIGIARCQFAVDLNYRNCGFGSLLVRKVVDKFYSGKLHKLSLHVTKDNITAIKIYLEAGFEFESRERAGFEKEDQYIMSIVR